MVKVSQVRSEGRYAVLTKAAQVAQLLRVSRSPALKLINSLIRNTPRVDLYRPAVALGQPYRHWLSPSGAKSALRYAKLQELRRILGSRRVDNMSKLEKLYAGDGLPPSRKITDPIYRSLNADAARADRLQFSRGKYTMHPDLADNDRYISDVLNAYGVDVGGR